MHVLMNYKRELNDISSERPMSNLVVLNHDPEKSKQKDILIDLPETPNVDIYLANGCFCGARTV